MRSDLRIHPGEILAEEIEARGWTLNDLTERAGMPALYWKAIMDGKQPITRLTAYRLKMALGTSAELWLNLQADYDATPPAAPEDEEG